jgi:hypothetical protein
MKKTKSLRQFELGRSEHDAPASLSKMRQRYVQGEEIVRRRPIRTGNSVEEAMERSLDGLGVLGEKKSSSTIRRP